MSRLPYDEVPFEKINPGDSCIVMTTSTGRSKMWSAKYLGQRKGRCVVDLNDFHTRLVDENDVEYDWRGESRDIKYPPYNRATYAEDQAAHRARIEERRKGYTFKKFFYVRRSTLQNNNIFNADMALKDFQL